MSGIKLKTAYLESKRREMGWTKGRLARQVGISSTTLYRISLPFDHPDYDGPGAKVIAGVLQAFPDATFEAFFTLESP